MEEVCKELDEVKAEMEKLKAEYQIKTDISESLKKAHNEQLIKFQEAKLQIEKQAQELNVKSEEISEARQISEDLKASLHEKELFLRHLNSANEKLRADWGEKVQKLEEENRELVSTLEESTVRNKDLEQKICASNEEIEGLKRLLSVSEKKCLEAEQKAQASKELRQRDEVIAKLEEEDRSILEQLKWKKEQFEHLEEAHKRLRDRFQSSKEEWEREKSALLEGISSLQTSLDSQTRITEGLQIQLKMCNQALAHEESKRKLLEVQLSEYNSRFENVFALCQEAQSKIESLTVQRDEEISKLRNLLGTRETLFKEMEFRLVHLEQENQELQGSLKEIQEAQINNARAASSLTKLQDKLRGLEQVHGNCSKNLKAKESEWSFQMEKMKEVMQVSISELKGKEKNIQELQKELEGFRFSLEVLNEEMAMVLVVLKSEFSEAYLKLLVDLEMERDEVALLLKRVESLNLMEQQQFLMEKELERHKKMLEESSRCQHHLREQLFQMENSLKEDRRDVSKALEKANSDLADKIRDKNRIEFESQKWKSTAENLKISLEESRANHKQMENSLLAQVKIQQTLKQEKESLLRNVEEQEKRIGDLQQQIVSLEIAAKMQAVEGFKQEKENYLRLAKEKDSSIENLQKKMAWLELESMRREFEAAILAQFDAEKTFEQEKERLLEVIKVKDQCIEDLRVLATSLEQDFTSATLSSFSEVMERQIEIIVLSEALNNAKHLTKVEIQGKNKIIAEMEKEVNVLHQKLEFQQESLFHSKRQVEQLEALLEANKSEIEKMTDQFGNECKSLNGLIKKLEFEKSVLLVDILKLSSEREAILGHIEGSCDQICEFSCEDAKLMGILEKILQTTEEKNVLAMDLIVSDVLNDSTRENATMPLFPATMKVSASIDERSPLMEINH
ncbi:hypothetical protein L1049_015895 [Liquidambar formosana]|uniref:Uncharacterized protein n=1 Tax=Liquidambar formosana TaxID=63359 RepID=A0AAP0RZQ9_LIQFO